MNPAAAGATKGNRPVSRGLHRWITFTAIATLALLGAGGLVTSHGVGMAVPDWPNTYGYNMFFFPISRWVGGVFYEHTHRLVASSVGLMTAVMAVWLYGRAARRFLHWTGIGLLVLALLAWGAAPARWADEVVLAATGACAFGASFVWPRTQPAPKWLRRLGVIAFVAVVFQGVLGGLRVILFRDQIGVFHAALAQLFFALVCALALVTSEWWWRAGDIESASRRVPVGWRWALVVTTMLILAQLVLGATMRHQHAGLAIPDFPLAYGKLWPATDPASVAAYNQHRIEVVSENAITAFQIVLQMAHRLAAFAIMGGVAVCAWLARRENAPGRPVRRLTRLWLGLILIQGLLGASTIWSNKAADVATAHVIVGALSLALGVMLCVISFRNVRAIGAFPVRRADGLVPLPSEQVLGHAARC